MHAHARIYGMMYYGGRADVCDGERVRSTPQAGVSYTLVPVRLFSLSYVTTGYTYLPRVKVQET